MITAAVAGESGGSLSVLSVLRLIRLTRITRIFKMSKNGGSLQGLLVLGTTLRKSAAALTMLFLFMLIFSILFATLIYTVEGGDYSAFRQQYIRADGSASPFESIPVSIWWTWVTMCTVGYGDQYPVTAIGKLIAVFTMLAGLIVLSLPITIVGANFNDEMRHLSQLKWKEAVLRESSLDEVGRENRETDVVSMIQEIISTSDDVLRTRVRLMLIEKENALRLQIKAILRKYADDIEQHTPLDEPKPAVPPTPPPHASRRVNET